MTASSVAGSSGSSVTTARSRRTGGARKSMATRPKDWADHANQALARVGSRERITGASLEQQQRDALEAGDEREAAPIGGGADNGECTGPSKGRRGEVHGDG